MEVDKSRGGVLLGGLVAAVTLAAIAAAPGSGAVTPPVSVFPIPGSRYNRPATQISFRGIPARAVGRIRVVGSRTGLHRGRLVAHSDEDGASFLPARPFAANERVTVITGLNVLGAHRGRFHYSIADAAPLIPNGSLTGIAPLRRGGVWHFRSEPGLQPAAVTVTRDAAPAWEGDIFLAPQDGPRQDGPMILDQRGQLVWFRPYPVAKAVFVNDLRVQDLYGQPVLTWWEGYRNTGFGQSRGVGVIVNRNYRRIATVRAADGLDAGSHEFLLTPDGDAYLTASSPVWLNHHHKVVIDSVVQEIDIKTGLVLFEWHALDHVSVSNAYTRPASIGGSFDPYHINSISLDTDGNLLVSMRNTSAVYKVDHRTGNVLWTLGGKRSSFTMGAGTSTYLQHDAIAQADGTLTIFDNGGWPPMLHPQSRGLRERLQVSDMSATLIGQYVHSPGVSASVEGGMQTLPSGDAFIGWGAAPYFSEYGPTGEQIFDAHFNESNTTYRAYRFPWSAQPSSPPAAAVSHPGRGVRTVYASWNGATDVAGWIVLAGPGPRRLAPISAAPRAGFETPIRVRIAAAYVAVEAVSGDGRVLGRSRVIAVSAHARNRHQASGKSRAPSH